jgi:hypothetical protein
MGSVETMLSKLGRMVGKNHQFPKQITDQLAAAYILTKRKLQPDDQFFTDLRTMSDLNRIPVQGSSSAGKKYRPPFNKKS